MYQVIKVYLEINHIYFKPFMQAIMAYAELVLCILNYIIKF